MADEAQRKVLAGYHHLADHLLIELGREGRRMPHSHVELKKLRREALAAFGEDPEMCWSEERVADG